MILPDCKVGHDGAVNTVFAGIAAPGLQILFDVDFPDPVQGYNVEIAYGFVVLRRVACGDNDKAVREAVRSEGFVLEKLQHGRSEGFRDAVDLVQKQDSFRNAASLDLVVDGGNDFAHGILGDRCLFPAVGVLLQKGQADGALPRVMRDGIGNKVDAAGGSGLLHDGGLADAGRSDEKERTLFFYRNDVFAGGISAGICFYCADDFFFGFLNVHGF